MKQIVTIKDLIKIYPNGVKALDKVSFDIKKGEIIGLLGPNGAGKSTLINIIAGIQDLTDGDINVWNYTVKNKNDMLEIKKRIGVVPQEISFDGFFTVYEMLKIHSGYFGIWNNKEHIKYLLNVFELWDKRNTNTRQLSGGMKRRLLIIKALLHKPSFVILDEPTAGVDVQLRKSLWEYIRKLNNEGTTILLTTHYLFEAEDLCERIAIIDSGKLLALDNVDTLKDSFGKNQKMHISLNSKIDSVPVVLDKFNPRYIQDTNRLSLEFKSENYGEIIDKLSESKLNIKKIDIESVHLEEIFLRLTDNKEEV